MPSELVVLVIGRQHDLPLNQLVEALAASYDVVVPAIIGADPADVFSVLKTMKADGHIVLLPFMLQVSQAENDRLEATLAEMRLMCPDATVSLATPVGFDPRIAELAAFRIEAAVGESSQASDVPIITITGTDMSQGISLRDLEALPDRLPDVSKIIPDRYGEAIPVRVLLDKYGISPGKSILFHSGDDFSAEVPWNQARADGYLVFKLDGRPLPARFGGPLRLFIPGGDDRCSNVKCVDRIEICS